MIISFKDAFYQCDQIGRKAQTLLNLYKTNDINVPYGIILTTDCYDKIVGTQNIEKINIILEKNISVKEKSKEIDLIFNDIKIDVSMAKEISCNIDKSKLYAIRSSGSMEDTDTFSFAGRYKSFLDVSYDTIGEKIIDCYRSLYSIENLSYVLENNLSTKDLKMAIIIQEMIYPQVSGICFTCNPLTGNDTQMIIEAVKGGCEDLASGLLEPERYFYNWKTDRYSGKHFIISEEKFREACKTFLRIQLLQGTPQDIEFGLVDGKLYILQSRPITKINYSSIKDVWTMADFREGGVSATVCKPLMWSLYEWAFDVSMRNFISHSNILTMDEMEKITQMYYGRGYWNITTIKKALNKIPSFKEEDLNIEYGIENIEGLTPTKLTPSSIGKAIDITVKQKVITADRERHYEEYKNKYLKKYDYYLSKIDSIDPKELFKDLILNLYIKVESYYYWQIFINTVYHATYRKFLLNHLSEDEFTTLLGGLKEVSHLKPFNSMWELSRRIVNNPEACAFWSNSSPNEILHSKYIRKVQPIIDEYGYHSEKELDISYPCYCEQPEKIIEMIKSMIDLSEEYSPQNKIEESNKNITEIIKKLKKKTNIFTYRKMMKIIEKIRQLTWQREDLKDISTKYYYLIRLCCLKLADELLEKDAIESKEDIWFLSYQDILDYIDSEYFLKDKIIKNKIYYNSYRNFNPQNEIGSAVSVKEIKDTQIHGVTANAGYIEGIARVIKDISEIDKIQPNDILITKFTDTGWTPWFSKIGGIVTEYGGVLCHAAIIAREYNIPAVVCCKNINKIKDGEKIILDANTGYIMN